MAEDSPNEASPNGDGPRNQKRDWFEKATLWTAIAGVIVVAASAGIALYTAFIIRGQLDEMKSSDPVLLAQSNAAVAISNTAKAQLAAAGKLADAAAIQSQAAKDQVVQMRAAVSAARDQADQTRESNRPIVVVLNPTMSVSGSVVTVQFLLENTGNQTALIDIAAFQIGPTLEFLDRPPSLDLDVGCPTIWGIRAIPAGQAFPLTCTRRIEGHAADLSKRNSWIRISGFWRYHSLAKRKWEGGDTIVCTPVGGYCAPSADTKAYDRPMAKSGRGLDWGDPASGRPPHQ